MYDRVYIGIGSNIGNRLQNIKKAIEIILKDKNVIVKKVSSIYETDPEEDDSLPKFYNVVIEIATEYGPVELLNFLKIIEKSMGREIRRKRRYEPRVIDLDIIAFDHLIIENDYLSIPHKKMKERKFVLIPMQEIAPNFVCPDCGITINDMIYKLRNNGKKVEKIGEFLLEEL